MDDSEREQRCRVETIARSWVGTPFHNHAGVKGAGVDCAQLLRCVFTEAGLIEPFDTGYYPPQFMLHAREERFLVWVQRFAREIEEAAVKPGDVVLFRYGHVYSHGAIVVSPGWPKAIIHAYSRSKRVTQTGGRDGELAKPVRCPRFFTRW